MSPVALPLEPVLPETPLDPKDVALAALTNLVRLMGAELVVGRHRDHLGLVERSMREKIAASSVEACPPEIAEAGLELATRCIEQALTLIRSQAIARAADGASAPDAGQPDEAKTTLH